MHQVSENTTRLAQKHALQSLESSRSMEEVGKRLQTDNSLGVEIGQSLEESGKNVVDEAENFLETTHKLAKDNSIESFSECLSAHVDANNSHIKAVNEFLKRGRNLLARDK